jgi:DedD protein
MGLTSFFKRKTSGNAPAPAARTVTTSEVAERVRTRTRQRLIGAVVLLTIGVIGFPLVFESQPRPIPVDIPIEIPRQETAPALVLPAPRHDLAATAAETAASHTADATAIGIVRESPADPMPAPDPAAAPAPAPATPPVAASTVARGKVDAVPAKPASSAEPPAEPARVAVPAPKAIASDAAVARAAPPAASATAAPDAVPASAVDGSARFVVQVGAFADPAAARELRVKMEKLGLKTYTQIAETPAGKRIRVRLGPFATRADADKAQARSKDAGIAAVVLTL